ncbi:translation initiation factor IF-3-like protein [Dinothrombium tinctorium]|uniref:Translation initiation factor IF-3-like protein n=1 Tax=Dinothrombium tinctorium TaxID=1965070 RepID=A0A3S3S1N1_9ACAR|nr:translation initiation factor IF-3-like protein [Dinothrombium tinctorium]RWS09152.1 translation initiation factor IF-3-like protein [Dinothrombium tinctorium]
MLGVKSILEAETLAKKNKLLLTFKSQSGKYPSYQLVDKFSPTKNENPSIECNEMRREKQKRKMKQLVWSPKITDHDFAIKLASAKKWLREGDDVKVCVTGKADKDTFENLFLRFSNSIKSEATIKQKSISATGLKFVCHPIAANISVEKHEKQEDMTTISDTEDPNEIVNKEVESLIQKESSESKT